MQLCMPVLVEGIPHVVYEIRPRGLLPCSLWYSLKKMVS